jgi:hypothetical protein
LKGFFVLHIRKQFIINAPALLGLFKVENEKMREYADVENIVPGRTEIAFLNKKNYFCCRSFPHEKAASLNNYPNK